MVKVLGHEKVNPTELEDPLLILHPQPDINYLKELAGSIKAVGQQQDIVVRKMGHRLQLVIGYCRTKAAATFGITTLNAKIIECSDKEAMLASATENIHRLEQDTIKEAELFLRLKTDHKMTDQEIANKFAKSYQYVRGRLDLLTLTENIQTMIKDKRLTIGAATALTKIPDSREQEIVAGSFIDQPVTVERAKGIVTAFLEYKKIMKEKPTEEVVQKAREELLAKCGICGELKPYSKLRGMSFGDEGFS